MIEYRQKTEVEATFPQASHVSDAHLPLDTADDVVELLRWQCQSPTSEICCRFAMDLLREAILNEDNEDSV